jgi:hypothetical protein
MKGTTMRRLILLFLCVLATRAFADYDVFITASNGTLMTNRFTNNAWTGWTPLDARPVGGPDATTVSGSPDVFYRGSDNALWQLQKRRGTWGTPVRIGGTITSDPAATTVNGELRAFARGTDAGMWQIGSVGSRWGEWEPLGGEFAEGAAPDAESHGNEITVVARGLDRAIWANFWDGSEWSDWTPLGGQFIGDPAVIYNDAQQRLEIYAVGDDRKMYVRTRRGTTWSGWDPLPAGEFREGTAPDATHDGNGIVLAARGTDDGAWLFINGAWQPVGGAMRANASIVQTSSGYYAEEAPARAVARYRVTLNGFMVSRETNDDPLERHGARDEIYLYAASDVIGRGAATRIVATRIFGDTHTLPDHVRGGSAWNTSLVGARGGFMTGDTFPDLTPWQRVGDPVAETRAVIPRATNTRPGAITPIPMTAWEGELARGENVLVLVPAIVESDHKIGALPTAPGERFDAFARAWRDRLAPNNVTAAAVNAVVTATAASGLANVTLPRSGDEDHPIGCQPVSATHYGWSAVPIVLTYERAEAMLGREEDFQVVRNGQSVTTTLPRGVSFIDYRDASDLGGHYTLFWQVERLP